MSRRLRYRAVKLIIEGDPLRGGASLHWSSIASHLEHGLALLTS
jgi:hypothetical protein